MKSLLILNLLVFSTITLFAEETIFDSKRKIEYKIPAHFTLLKNFEGATENTLFAAKHQAGMVFVVSEMPQIDPKDVYFCHYFKGWNEKDKPWGLACWDYSKPVRYIKWQDLKTEVAILYTKSKSKDNDNIVYTIWLPSLPKTLSVTILGPSLYEDVMLLPLKDFVQNIKCERFKDMRCEKSKE